MVEITKDRFTKEEEKEQVCLPFSERKGDTRDNRGKMKRSASIIALAASNVLQIRKRQTYLNASLHPVGDRVMYLHQLIASCS